MSEISNEELCQAIIAILGDGDNKKEEGLKESLQISKYSNAARHTLFMNAILRCWVENKNPKEDKNTRILYRVAKRYLTGETSLLLG